VLLTVFARWGRILARRAGCAEPNDGPLCRVVLLADAAQTRAEPERESGALWWLPVRIRGDASLSAATLSFSSFGVCPDGLYPIGYGLGLLKPKVC